MKRNSLLLIVLLGVVGCASPMMPQPQLRVQSLTGTYDDVKQEFNVRLVLVNDGEEPILVRVRDDWCSYTLKGADYRDEPLPEESLLGEYTPDFDVAGLYEATIGYGPRYRRTVFYAIPPLSTYRPHILPGRSAHLPYEWQIQVDRDVLDGLGGDEVTLELTLHSEVLVQDDLFSGREGVWVPVSQDVTGTGTIVWRK